MERGRPPQGHGKKTGQGSVNVNKTDKVDTGGKPVGFGSTARPQSTGSSGGQRPRISRAAPTGGGAILLIILAILLIRGCGGAQGGVPAAPVQQPVQVTAAPTSVPTSAPTAKPTPAPTPVPAQTGASAGRAHRYTPKSGDTVTVMVYMCGTDLESNYGMATSDLQEMASATIGSNVNVIVETGGCRMWKNKIVSSSTNQIYKVETGGVRQLEADVGRESMTRPATLTNFIDYCQENFPAQRNILILWDHGGGSISGYGHDELFKNTGSMDLAGLRSALREADCTFDWIGFDACLMATLETAVVCNDYADYLLASEETEPGTGWFYTNWLNTLSKNTAVDTVTLGKQIINDFVNTNKAASSSPKVTLSLVDLAEMQGTVLEAFRDFALSTTELLSSNRYTQVSQARAGTRQFAQSSRINQIDLVDFANRIGTPEAQALSQAILGCVKVNGKTISNCNGLSIYFPYESMSSVKTAVSTYNQVGMDDAYTKCISSFASLASSGQLSAAAGAYGGSYGSGYTAGGLDLGSLLGAYLGGGASSAGGYGGSYGSSPLGSLLGGYPTSSGSQAAGSAIDMNSMLGLLSAMAGSRNIPADMDWLDTDIIERNMDYLSSNYIDPADITVTVRNDGSRALSLTDEQWDLINTVEVNVFVDDGEGFLDMGYDQPADCYTWDDNGDMVFTYDGTWLTLDRQPVAFYMESSVEEADGSWTTRGVIPAMLTHTTPATGDLNSLDGVGGDGSDAAAKSTQMVYLEVVFDAANPDGVVTGARPMYEDGTESIAKGEIELLPGDVLEFLCDYYGYDGSYDGAWKLDSRLTVGSKPLEIEYLALDEVLSVTYRLTDIYNNYYWTPAWIA